MCDDAGGLWEGTEDVVGSDPAEDALLVPRQQPRVPPGPPARPAPLLPTTRKVGGPRPYARQAHVRTRHGHREAARDKRAAMPPTSKALRPLRQGRRGCTAGGDYITAESL